MNLAMYILINSDVKFGKAVLAGQVGHAVGIYHYRGTYTDELMENYMKKPRKILLACPQNKLEELERDGYITIRENDTPQLPKNTLTCINYGIYDRESPDMPELLKGLKLYPK